MAGTIYSTDIPKRMWMKMGTREELRDQAREEGIVIGRNKEDTANNLSKGVPRSGKGKIKFKVYFCVY